MVETEAVIPECYIDTNLIQSLVPPATRYNHQKGCDNVAKVMQSKYKGRVAVGIIDKDKRKISYLKEFEEIRSYNGDLFLLRHHSEKHYLIQISPAIEAFIIKASQEANINLSDFDLPDQAGALKKITGNILTQSDVRFKKLFRELKDRNCNSVETLIRWVDVIKNSKYEVKEELL
ncbi:MAG: hypothetical protein BGO31_17245 [Bacteroidetes bacterium 43-16]|nr:MAG: hypothetical protein BGO31_17245 [Bacteroidetes bacterium 43-16]